MPNSKPIRNTDPESELDPATGNSELEIVTPQSTLNSAPDRAHNPETAAGDQLTDLSSLIENLEEAGSHPRRAEQEQRQNDLVLVRMGIASSLLRRSNSA